MVEVPQRNKLAEVLCSEDSVGRLQKISDGTAFAHELWVVTDSKVSAEFTSTGLLYCRNHQRFGRARENCASQNDQVVRVLIFQYGADFGSYTLHVRQIEFSTSQAGRTYANKRNFRLLNRYRRAGRGMQSAGSTPLGNQFVHPRFDDWATA